MLAVGSLLENDPKAEHREADDEHGQGDQSMDARLRRPGEHYEQPDSVERHGLFHAREAIGSRPVRSEAGGEPNARSGTRAPRPPRNDLSYTACRVVAA